MTFLFALGFCVEEKKKTGREPHGTFRRMELASDLRPTVGLDKGEPKMLARVDFFNSFVGRRCGLAVVDAVDTASDARPVSPNER